MKLANGKYYDGLSAISHDVQIHHTGAALHIQNHDQTLNIEWPLDHITVIQPYHRPQPAKLALIKGSEARLFIEDPADWNTLKSHLPKSAFNGFHLPFSVRALTLYALAAIAVIAGIFLSLPKMLENGAYMIPKHWENQLGDYVVKTVMDRPICTEKNGMQALNKMTEKLTRQTTRDVDYKFHVLHQGQTLNAFAAPGGHIMIFSAIIDKADTPEEVAGIIAHEIAHNELAHPTRAIMRDMGLSLTISMMLGSNIAGDAAGLIKTLSELSYSREKELEADRLGQDLLYNANIDPAAMTLFFKRIQKREIQIDNFSALQYLSTHPQTADRIDRLENAKYDSDQNFEPILTHQQWQDLKNICDQKKTYGAP